MHNPRDEPTSRHGWSAVSREAETTNSQGLGLVLLQFVIHPLASSAISHHCVLTWRLSTAS